jgi:hypothetical protein
LFSFRQEKCHLILERGLLSTLEQHKKTDGDAAGAGVEGDVGGGQEAAEVEQNGGGRARTVSQVEVEGSTPKVKTTFCLVLVLQAFEYLVVLDVFVCGKFWTISLTCLIGWIGIAIIYDSKRAYDSFPFLLLSGPLGTFDT